MIIYCLLLITIEYIMQYKEQKQKFLFFMIALFR